MSQREQGKFKSLRIDLEYHRQKSWLDRYRTAMTILGLCIGLLYSAWVLLADRAESLNASRSTQLSTGALALVHSSFEHDCQKCHSGQLGLALASDAWQWEPEQRLAIQDQKCQSCHKVDHHSRDILANPSFDQDCAACHRDHAGRERSLTSISSSTCIACHSNLNAACKPNHRSQLASSIADFSSTSHGIDVPSPAAERTSTQASMPASSLQFRSLLKDRGRIKFDHAQHLRPGQVEEGSRGGFEIGMLPPEMRTRYRSQELAADSTNRALVQLNCSHCHQPQKIHEPGRESSTAREEGRYYAPVQFDEHCSACHQITFGGQQLSNLPLPHVAQREEYAQLLAAKQTSEARDGGTEARVDAIFIRCAQCHFEQDLTRESIARALAGTFDPLIPQRWLERGLFDHASHRRIERCDYCHVMPTESGPPTDHQRVLIRGPDSCTPCHRDPQQPLPSAFQSQLLGSQPMPTWATAECVLCHRYHWTRPDVQLLARPEARTESP